MPRNGPPVDNSFDSLVYMLSEHNFDKVANLNLLKQDDQYRLVREQENMHDENAIAVYFGPLKIGYLERGIALIVSKLIDNGDVFSVGCITGYKGTHYDPQFDNKKGDGYYRKLIIRVTNESGLARAQGKELDDAIKFKYQTLHQNPTLTKTTRGSVMGCLFFFFILMILYQIFIALAT